MAVQRRWFSVLSLTCLLAPASLAAAEKPDPPGDVFDLGDRLELFVDRHMIESLSDVRLVLHPPQPREVVLKTDAAWEGKDSAYFTVFQDGDRFRMYYRGLGASGLEVTCYAESRDGIDWTRPKLGQFEFDGSKENNIVWQAGPRNSAHNFTPFKDTRPGVADDERYKALAGTPLVALASADGLRWRLLSQEPVLTKGAFDSQNLAFWDPNHKKYASYYRIFAEGVRAISKTESDDFLHWSEPVPIDLGDTPREHFYTNATTPYFRAPHYYFAFPKRFVPDRKRLTEHNEPGISEGVFLSSRDGLHFDRTFLEAFIRPGRDRLNWGDRSNMTAWGLVETAPDEMSLYYSQHYGFPTHHLRRGVLRLDGIASAQAGYGGGELITRPVRFRGGKLVLNYSTAASGGVQVEIQGADGKPLAGFTLADAPPLFGDDVAEVYAWKTGNDVSSLAGKIVRLRFVLKDADLYSYRISP
jgi:hypothetical protein